MELSTEKAYCGARQMFFLLVLASAVCAGLHTVADSDMGWHLATGRYVIQHHAIPRTDVLSYTSPGKPWAYPPFAGVLLYLTYRAFGYAGLSWFCALACLAVVAYLVWRRDIGSAVLAMLAIQSIAARTAPRADLFSTVFFVIFLGELWAYQRGMRTRLWLLPVLMFLWVNLHPGFVAGLGAIGAYLLIEMTDLLFAGRRAAALRRLRRIWPWLAACGVVTFLNPWGPKIYGSAATLSGLAAPCQGGLNSGTFIGEYMAVPISTHLLYQLIDLRHMENGFTWLLLVAVVLVALFLWKRQPGAAVVVAVALYAGLAHARYMGLFVIVVVTFGSTLFDELFSAGATPESDHASPSVIRVPYGTAALLSFVLCAMALLHVVDFVSSRTYVVFNSDWRFGGGLSSWFPARAAAFIQREQLPGNIYEEYALGGYAAWSLGPEYPDFIDGRGDRLRPDLVVEQRKLYIEDPDSRLWEEEADRWNFNAVLVSTAGFRSLQKMNPSAFCRSASWRPVYMDEVSLVFVRNLPQNRPWIDRLQIDCNTQPLAAPASASRPALYDFYLDSGALFFTLHRDRESEESLRRASRLYPEDPNAPLLLAALYQRQQRLHDAEQEYRAALALNDSAYAWYSLGRLYASEGRNSDAVRAIERAADLSVDPLDMYMALGSLQIAQNHASQSLAAYAKAENSSPFRNGGESLAPELYAQIAEGRSEAHRLLGHWAEAIAYQQEATRRTPLVMERWNRLARLYEATGQMGLAAEARERAAALQGSNTPR